MTYQVEIEPLGEVIEVEEGQTILDASLRAGIYLPYACGHGLCATCKVDVLEGDVEHGEASPFALMDMEKGEGKCLACCAIPTSDLVIEADVEEDPDAESHQVRDFSAKVIEITDLNPRIKGIFLEIENDTIEFQAGHYINLEIPGVAGPARAFSIANSPSDNSIVELNISLVQGGEGTTYIHEQLKVGDELNFSGPYGRFFVRNSAPEPMLFLAGGSGLSSPKSMVLDQFEKGEERKITLIYGARNQQELYYREIFEALAEQHTNFRYIPALSEEPADSNWQGERGMVHEVANSIYDGNFEGNKAYMCGPPPMIDACISTLMQGRCFEKHMFMEHFYTNASKDEKPKSPLFKNI
ncbi:MAG TPA: 2Fe-2S iron-sulfur cluster binding domain-containing protein [Thiotrichaceae bacterium]|jgi:phenol hydroxylase P5 protein|nr:2Fe-2S iron-sulfur cluster binding domain-containing protein [Thiotrichaceae bacterium]HIM08048.1 2Fe-2S iron-sulfur cluster binding domain-containing protein [Gammaproteobacteria bacterium]